MLCDFPVEFLLTFIHALLLPSFFLVCVLLYVSRTTIMILLLRVICTFTFLLYYVCYSISSSLKHEIYS